MSNRAALRSPDPTFWRGKRVLLTGHTGFKGAWLALWLHRLGARVAAFALPPNQTPSLFAAARIPDVCESRILDLRDAEGVAMTLREVEPEVVLHLGAQALVRASYRDPLGTFNTNVIGTANLLEAVAKVDAARVVVAVTTDKVYRNDEHTYPYRELDPLGGHDPYSASKAACELVVASYEQSFLRARGVAVATARAGNVIGGGDWSEDRLVPDAVRAWQAGRSLAIRNPRSVRPWQHVLEPLAAYLRLAEALWTDHTLAGAYNFGPDPSEAAPVAEVIQMARLVYGRGDWEVESSPGGPHEAGWLSLETARARHRLGIAPRWRLEDGVRRTMDWYRRHAAGADARALCAEDIESFVGMGEPS